VSTVTQKNPLHYLQSYFFKIRFNINHLRQDFPNVLFASDFPTKARYKFLFISICAKFPANLAYNTSNNMKTLQFKHSACEM
jgi:hypothetical protein